MHDIDKFNRFTKPRRPEKVVPTNRDVVLYTRVSSKDQGDNYSLEYQREESLKFAEQNGYNIIATFGNVYESASSDISRKEFQELIGFVKNSEKKPFAILVYVINRFSRTGADAITILEDLVEKMNVHLIEVTTGLDTTTFPGKYAIYNQLLDAIRQNHERLKHTIPGMKKFVKAGNYLARVYEL